MRIFYFLFFLCLSLNAYDIESLISSDKFKALYHISNGSSEIKDKKFFLSKEGFNPSNELYSLINNMTNDNICKYPARYKFLSENLNLEINFNHCTNLKNFLKDFKFESISMVFASSYLGSPTSYFGHTFIKLNKKNNTFFSQTLGYVAKVSQTESFFNIIGKGLSGGFEGKYIYKPYYKLVEEYNVIEQRDLIEYKLDLTKDEIYDMLLHAYELKNIEINYDFFKENCAYQVLWFIQNAKPSLSLIKDINNYIIPFETISLLAKYNLIKSSNTRLSKINQLYRVYSKLTKIDKVKFSKWKDSSNKEKVLDELNLDDNTKENFKYLINGYYDILFKRYKFYKKDFKEVKNILYKSKSNLIEGDEFKPNKPHKITFSRAYSSDNYYNLEFRPILFDKYEKLDSYLNQKSLEIMNISLNYLNNDIKIKSVDIIRLESFSKKFDFYNPSSWKAYFGLNDKLSNNVETEIELGYGTSYGTENILYYGMIDNSIFPQSDSLNLKILYGINYKIMNYGIYYDASRVISHIHKKEKNKDLFKLYVQVNKNIDLSVSYEDKANLTRVSLGYFF